MRAIVFHHRAAKYLGRMPRDRMGSGRWIARLKNGNTLILKPE